MADPGPTTDLRGQILSRTAEDLPAVWTPGDFADIAGRAAIDKTLQRLATNGELRRVDRGLYDRPSSNRLTGKPTVPNYQAVIRAVARRDNARFVVDGMTAANDLGLTTAVPAKIEVLIDARLKPINLGKQEIRFKHAAVSRLTWAGRPGMRGVQALHWLQDVLSREEERGRIATIFRRLLTRTTERRFGTTSAKASRPYRFWMQEFLRPLLFDRREAAS